MDLRKENKRYDIWYDIWYMIWYDIWYMIWYDIWYDMIYDMIWYDDMTWRDVTWYMIWCDVTWRDMIWYMIWYMTYDMIYDMIIQCSLDSPNPDFSRFSFVRTDELQSRSFLSYTQNLSEASIRNYCNSFQLFSLCILVRCYMFMCVYFKVT